MKTYLAIRRHDRAEPSKGRDTREGKRRRYREATLEASSETSALLEKEGLERLDRGAEQLAVAEKQPRRSAFTTFEHLDAFSLEVADRRLEEVQEMVGKDYDLVPNIALSLPAVHTPKQSLGRASRRQKWPEACGIDRAQEELGLRGEDVLLAVLDTGCDADHVQFSETLVDFRYFPPRNPNLPRGIRGFDPDGHGTHVCGIMAGKDTGIAPGATLLVASVVESESTKTSLRRILAALDWVAYKASEPGTEGNAVILNLSLGFRPSDVAAQFEGALNRAFRGILAQLAEEADVLPVVSIGNEGANTFRFPGAYPEVLGIGAVDNDFRPWPDSGGGRVELDGEDPLQKPDAVGLGVDVYSSVERNTQGHSRYARKSGTSMAAPYAAGVAALMAQQHGCVGAELRRRLLETALPLEAEGPPLGAGLLRFVE